MHGGIGAACEDSPVTDTGPTKRADNTKYNAQYNIIRIIHNTGRFPWYYPTLVRTYGSAEWWLLVEKEAATATGSAAGKGKSSRGWSCGGGGGLNPPLPPPLVVVAWA